MCWPRWWCWSTSIAPSAARHWRRSTGAGPTTRSSLPGTIAAVRALAAHPAFSRANPNRVRALVGAFSQANPVHFHAASGEGYDFLADEVLALDRANPPTAARLVQPLGQWRRYDAARQGLMRAALDRILATAGLSPNTY